MSFYTYHPGFLVGPLIGGLLFDYVGEQAPYMFCAGLAGLDLLFRLLVKSPKEISSTLLSKHNDEQSLLDVSSSQPIEQYGLIPGLDFEPIEESTLFHDSPYESRIAADKPKGSMWTLVSDPQVLCTCFTVFFGASVFSGTCKWE